MGLSKDQEREGQAAIPYQEYLLRVLFASFQPAVRLGLELNYPLDTIKEMMTLALWREAKAKHNKISLISLIFGKSTRTLKTLSARYNRGRFFEQSETNLCRQVEDLLARRAMTLDELSRRLPHYNEFDGAKLAVQMLLENGRITEAVVEGEVVYTPISRHHNLVSDDWEARIDALSEHINAVGETLHRRFLESEPDPRALARTFTFQARTGDIEAFQAELLEFIRSKYREIEERALADLESGVPIQDQLSADDLFNVENEQRMKESIEHFALYVGVTPTPRGASHENS